LERLLVAQKPDSGGGVGTLEKIQVIEEEEAEDLVSLLTEK
jgi:hypothetical protein